MAGIKISALPAVPSALLTDFYPVVQGGVTSRETVQQLFTLFNSSLTGFLPIAGGTMTGNLILNADATLPLQAVTYEQLQTVAAGFTVVLACQAATTANLNSVYANGAAGVGATLTNAGAMAAFAVDGYSASLNDRILVKDQTNTFENGIYTVTTVGSGAANWVLTRATDYDEAPSEIKPGTLVAINNGTVNATTSWLETATVATVGTDPILFSQFTFSPSSFLLRANNLSDLISVAAALVNLGLGVPTGTGNVVLQTSPTLVTPILGAASATSLTFTSTSGIIGTTTNDNAAAGSVGEFMSSVVPLGSAINLLNNIAANVTSIVLTAGDWDVWGNVAVIGSGNNLAAANGWISLTSATLPDPSVDMGFSGAAAFSAVNSPVPSFRFSVAINTTVYLSARAFFPVSGSATGCGGIYARRRR